ncbi:MAG: enoyl-CoA hydratase-related protein [Bacillota bacterium]|nr:enoyl-CoA hydratase-related protein [Bacillota bacterium]MDW7684738.1 enoyl-CoA hydratase-related protein [Bacillota bacterium]
MGSVLFEVSSGVAKITLNRPEAFNALNEDMMNNLSQQIEHCFAPEIRAVIITGAGKAFCGGGDLKEMQKAGDKNLSSLLGQLTQGFHRLILDIRYLPKPVIAAVNGSNGGGGFSLALACDLRYAAESAQFKQSYTSVGLCPDGGFTAFLPAVIGLAKSSELFFLDPVLSADQAKQLGIVNDLFSPEELIPNVTAIAERLANGPTQSYAAVKKLLNLSLLPNLEKQLEQERQGMIAAGLSTDAKEGVRAFTEKRTPTFIGK